MAKLVTKILKNRIKTQVWSGRGRESENREIELESEELGFHRSLRQRTKDHHSELPAEQIIIRHIAK